MGISETFERKFLLGWGRHLWNIVGVSGFIAVLNGGVLFLNSTILEVPKTKNKYTEKVRNEVKNLEKVLSVEVIPDVEIRAEKFAELYDKQRELTNLEFGYERYLKEIERKNEIKLGQRVLSPFIAGYGLAVIASASVSTALLSIERNTRKD